MIANMATQIYTHLSPNFCLFLHEQTKIFALGIVSMDSLG